MVLKVDDTTWNLLHVTTFEPQLQFFIHVFLQEMFSVLKTCIFGTYLRPVANSAFTDLSSKQWGDVDSSPTAESPLELLLFERWSPTWAVPPPTDVPSSPLCDSKELMSKSCRDEVPDVELKFDLCVTGLDTSISPLGSKLKMNTQ